MKGTLTKTQHVTMDLHITLLRPRISLHGMQCSNRNTTRVIASLLLKAFSRHTSKHERAFDAPASREAVYASQRALP